MSQSLGAYLPQDRLHALARGESLPEHAAGTALFADISGFTPLTEALNLALGSRRGAEALSQQINQIYTALVQEVEHWHGSVIGFAGDALTCWFDSNDGLAAPRAAACAAALQQAMAAVNRVTLPDGTVLTLGLKVALASGPARRFVVGDPDFQQFDVLAGQTLTRVAAVEHRANSGEVLLDQATADTLADTATLGGWRDDPEHDARYALLASLNEAPAPAPWSELPPGTPSSEQLRPWLLPAIYQRYQDGLGDFLTELRPLVGVFIRFVGIDYDLNPDAGPKLDALTRVVQQALARYEGALLQITIGDKGSSFYAAFGAPVAHEDDLQRAVQAALEIQQAALALGGVEPLQIGISQGTLIVGAYGAASRLTYAALGDEINLAARLMMQAAPGETLLSGRGQRALVNAFVLEPRPPIRVKGKAEPLPVMAILARRRRRSIRLEEPSYALPMVGRSGEVRQIIQVLDAVAGGAGRVLAITGEAGLGKSRLVAEAIRLGRQRGLLGYGGACQATGVNTPYLVWESIWRAFFDIDPEATVRKQARVLEGAIEDLAPERVEVLPLLGPLLGINLPDNDFTHGLQPKDRQGALHALLRECLVAAAREAQADGGGLLLVLEDLHWIDGASLQLLGDLAEAVADLPVLFVLAYRPTEQERQPLTRIEALPFFSTIALDGLENTSSEDLIRAKLAQLFPARSGPLPAALVARLTERAQGNPFYLEELLNYLHDRAIDPYDTAAIEALDLPESLYSLVLSRLDQLSSQQQALLKMASVIGRRFLVAWLDGAFANMRLTPELQADLLELARTDLTAADLSEPETAYLFKHVVTQQVAYESLSASTRAMLHEQLASYLESLSKDDVTPYLDLLAYHYSQSNNREKQREYLRRAAYSAAERFANQTAIEYINAALKLATDDDEKFYLLLNRAEIYGLIGMNQQQADDIELLNEISDRLGQGIYKASIGLLKSEVATRVGNASDAINFTREAIVAFDVDRMDKSELVRYPPRFINALRKLSSRGKRWFVFWLSQIGDYDEAISRGNEWLNQAKDNSDLSLQSQLIYGLAAVEERHGNTVEARKHFLEALELFRYIGDQYEVALTVAYMGTFPGLLCDFEEASLYNREGLDIFRAVGNVRGESWVLSNIGMLAFRTGDYARAYEATEQSFRRASKFGDIRSSAVFQVYLGRILDDIKEFDRSDDMYKDAAETAKSIKDLWVEGVVFTYRSLLLYHRGAHEEAVAHANHAIETLAQIGNKDDQAAAATTLAFIHHNRGDLAAAEKHYSHALTIRQASQHTALITELRAHLARVQFDSGDILGAQQEIRDLLPSILPPSPAPQDEPRLGDEGKPGPAPQAAGRLNIQGMLEPFQFIEACYTILSAPAGDASEPSDGAEEPGNDPLVAQLLGAAVGELRRRASTIDDEAIRNRYLTSELHARIIEAHKKAHS